jgi:hypothetical protein
MMMVEKFKNLTFNHCAPLAYGYDQTKSKISKDIGYDDTLYLLSAYMKYIRESIGFIPKKLKFFFCSNHVFYQ